MTDNKLVLRAFIETKHRRVGQLQIDKSGIISQDKGFRDATKTPLIYAEIQQVDSIDADSIFVTRQKPDRKFQFKKFENFEDADFENFEIYKVIATDRLNAYKELQNQVDAHVTAKSLWAQVEYHNENNELLRN